MPLSSPNVSDHDYRNLVRSIWIKEKPIWLRLIIRSYEPRIGLSIAFKRKSSNVGIIRFRSAS